jgi:hypothetical protein
MLKDNLKKSLAIGIIALFLPFKLSALDGGKQLTLSGASGFITTPDFDTVNGLAMGIYIPTNFSDAALLARFALGLGDYVEFYGGVDVPFSKKATLQGLMTGIKWKFYSKENVHLGMLITLQANNVAGKLKFNPQVLFGVDWLTTQTLESSAHFGKTFGPGTSFSDWDFGLGVKWWFFNSEPFNMALVTDFANYSYRAQGVEGMSAGNIRKGMVNIGFRMGFRHRTILLDIGTLDIFDSGRGMYVSLSGNINI